MWDLIVSVSDHCLSFYFITAIEIVSLLMEINMIVFNLPISFCLISLGIFFLNILVENKTGSTSCTCRFLMSGAAVLCFVGHGI